MIIFNIKVMKIIFVLLLSFNLFLFADEYAGKVYSEIEPINRFVNIGPIFINDSIFFNFFLINSGEKDLYLQESFPTYIMGLSELDPGESQFNLFSTKAPELPITIKNNIQNPQKLTIRFNSRDTTRSKIGWHHANFQLGLSKTDNLVETITLDTFKLKAKKTKLFIDGFDDVINFDSVMINPNNEINYTWRLKNVIYYNVKLDKQIETLITQPASQKEIIIEKYIDGFALYPKEILNYNIKYSPLNRGRDSTLLKIQYHYNEIERPDSVNFAKVMIIGTGVEQSLSATESNYDIIKDTIDLGVIRLGNQAKIELKIKNTGNLPFGSKSYSFYEDLTSKIDNRFLITEILNKNNIHLLPDSSSFLKFSFQTDKIGAFFSRLVIESDIIERSIKGINNSHKTITFYIKGKVTSPLMALLSDTVDFGNVNLNNVICESTQDTNLIIRNIGNETLRISNISVSPQFPNSRFIVSDNSLEIEPNQEGFISINFIPNSGEYESYSADLILNTNQPTNELKYIKLMAKSIPPIAANLLIPKNIKSYPGNAVIIPVIIENDQKNAASFANSFKAELIYDKSILEFTGIRTVGTATEGAVNSGDLSEIFSKDFVNINLSMPIKTFFQSGNDTLFLLKFNTFLGADNSSPIALINAKFGDEKCEDILKLNISDGIYTTDSVCGLDKKVGVSAKGFSIINQKYSSKNAIYTFLWEAFKVGNLRIKVYDYYGNSLKALQKTINQSGLYSDSVDLSGLISGVYFIDFDFENETQNYIFVIEK